MKHLLLLLLLMPSAFAVTISLEKGKSYEVQDFKGVQISEEKCRKGCEAKKIINGPKVDFKNPKSASHMNNPTSYLCEQIKGKPEIGIMKDESEVSICLFKDESFLFIWDYARKVLK